MTCFLILVILALGGGLVVTLVAMSNAQAVAKNAQAESDSRLAEIVALKKKVQSLTEIARVFKGTRIALGQEKLSALQLATAEPDKIRLWMGQFVSRVDEFEKQLVIAFGESKEIGTHPKGGDDANLIWWKRAGHFVGGFAGGFLKAFLENKARRM
jgi:hypothetical protein